MQNVAAMKIYMKYTYFENECINILIGREKVFQSPCNELPAGHGAQVPCIPAYVPRGQG